MRELLDGEVKVMQAGTCKQCGGQIEWAWEGEGQKWVPLELTDRADDLPMSFVDENGEFRADHRDRHDPEPPINVTRLRHQVPPRNLRTDRTADKQE